jgi:hypothetical protein
MKYKEIFEEIKSKVEPDKWGQKERDHYDAIYCYMRYKDKEGKYTHIFDQAYSSCDWNLMDLNQIMYYVYEHNLNMYETLRTLAGDYYWAMYLITPAQPGIQSTACMILDDLDYDYENKCKHTPEIDAMVKEINGIKTDLHMAEFKHSTDILLKLYKREVEKYLKWGEQIF